VAEVVYNVGKDRVRAGLLTSGTTVLRAVLIVTSKTGADNPDLATVAAIDAVGTVALGTERVTLTGVTITIDNANDRINIDCANFAFAAAAGVTGLACLVYDATTDTSDATRIPLGFFDTGFGAGLPIDGGLNATVNDLFRIT